MGTDIHLYVERRVRPDVKPTKYRRELIARLNAGELEPHECAAKLAAYPRASESAWEIVPPPERDLTRWPIEPRDGDGWVNPWYGPHECMYTRRCYGYWDGFDS